VAQEWDNGLMNTIWGKEIAASEFTKEILLCRGFIPEDPENLSLGLSIKSSSPLDQEYLLKHYKTDNIDKMSYKSIRAMYDDVHSHGQFAYGISGINDFSGMLNENFQTFRKCKFGVKVPVSYLDPGIALLVKTLPLIGVMTAMSCGGHLKDDPVIIIRNEYHLNWVRHVFTYLFGAVEGFSIVNDDTSWQGCKLVFATNKSDESSYFNAYWKAQTMARFLLDQDNSQKIRAAKELLENEDQLNDESYVHSILDQLGVKKLQNK
jgi:hypothetical protein